MAWRGEEEGKKGKQALRKGEKREKERGKAGLREGEGEGEKDE